MKQIIFLAFLIFTLSSHSQCVPPNSSDGNCSYSAVVNSTNGYQVVINVTPSHIIAPSNCPNGYSSNVALNYNIQFTGNNQPASLWNLQFTFGCDPFNYTGSFPTSGGIGTSNSTNSPYRNSSDCSTITFNSLGCDNLNIFISGPGITGQNISMNCVVQSTHPAEGTFGEDEWILYGYEGTNYQEYKGYYKESSLNFDSRDHFAINLSPSSAVDYEGCSISNNNHSYKVLRQGFSCGFYKIDIIAHDRRMKLFVNGVEVYEQIGVRNTPLADVWEGFLDENSTVEIQIRSFNGDSFGAIDLINLNGSDYVVWQGNNNTDFNNSNNWCGGIVPDSNDSVLIPENAINPITISGNVTFHSLILNQNSVLNISENATLNLTGNLTNNGVINSTEGKIIFNGNSAQTIAGNGFEVKFLELNNNEGLTLNLELNDLLTVNKLLTVTSGSLHTNNQVYLPCEFISGGDECQFTTSVASINGYNVQIKITPKQVITANNTCPFGYNYNIEYDYEVLFSGNNIPASLFTLNASLTCDVNDLIFFSIPTSGGVGSATSTSNPYRNESDCATATVYSLGCNSISINIEGPGINLQTIDLLCDYGVTGGAAQIAPLGGEIDGEITVEQCFSATRAFRFITSSVSSTGSIRENWQENPNNWNHDPKPGYGTHITGVGNGVDGTNGFDFNPSGAPSMFVFNNITQGWGSVPNTNTQQLTAGFPYRILIRGSRSINLQSNNATPNNTKIRTKGTVLKGPYNVPNLSTTTGHFNLIGNPFHAKVDIEAVLNESSNVSPYVYYWDPTIGSRGAYVTINPLNNSNNNMSSDANKYIQPYQAVFIQTLNENITPIVTFKENHKVVNESPATIFKSVENQESYINLTLFQEQAYANNNSSSDGVRIDFSSTGSNEIDYFDAIKVTNLDENIAVKNQENLLSIEQRSLPQPTEIIPINITNYKTTQYVMKMKSENIEGVNAYLKDYYTNSQTLINQGSITTYTFSIDNLIAESTSNERFAIIFEGQILGLNQNEMDLMEVFPNPFNDRIVLNFDSSLDRAEVQIINMLGQIVYHETKTTNSSNQIVIQNLNLPIGQYVLKSSSNSGETYQTKIIKK